MRVYLTFDEITTVIKKEAGLSLRFIFVNSNAVKVKLDMVKMAVLKVGAGITLSVPKIDGTDVYIDYGGGGIAPRIVKRLLPLALKFNAKLATMIERTARSQLVLHLGNIDAIARVLKSIQLTAISADQGGLFVDFRLIKYFPVP